MTESISLLCSSLGLECLEWKITPPLFVICLYFTSTLTINFFFTSRSIKSQTLGWDLTTSVLESFHFCKFDFTLIIFLSLIHLWDTFLVKSPPLSYPFKVFPPYSDYTIPVILPFVWTLYHFSFLVCSISDSLSHPVLGNPGAPGTTSQTWFRFYYPSTSF